MVQRTKSVSRGAVLSGAQGGRAQPFDVRSWQGLTELLQAARDIGLSDENYSELRDIVLQYAQSGGDETLRKQVDEAIAKFNITRPKVEEEDTFGKKEMKSVLKPPLSDGGTIAPPASVRRPTPQFVPQIRTPQTPQQPIIASEPPVERQQVETPMPPEDAVPHNLPTVHEATAFAAQPVNNLNQQMPQSQPSVQQVPPQQVFQQQVSQSGVPVQQPPMEAQTLPPVTQFPPTPVQMQQQFVQQAPQMQQLSQMQSVPMRTLEDHKRRIAEIKHEVNAKVGNPVTLIEAGNSLGKDYMNALLSAMKASAAGYTGSLDVEMARLENAADLILKQPIEQLKKQPDRESAQSPVQKPAEISVPENTSSADLNKSAPVVEEVKSEEEQQAEIPGMQLSGTVSEIAATDAEIQSVPTVQTTTPVRSKEPEKKEDTEIPQPAAPFASPPAPELKKEAGTPTPKPPSRSVKPQGEKEIPPLSDKPVNQNAPATAKPVVPKIEPAVLSVADMLKKKVGPDASAVPPEKKNPDETGTIGSPTIPSVNTPKTSTGQGASNPPATALSGPSILQTGVFSAPTQDAGMIGNSDKHAARVPNQTEISSPEVTTGLNQLLSEWNLFKSSGLLGIGPRGMEHPLYKKLAQLSMFAVVAGRWENSSPKVTQSIKDYVNAWRHEQGIMYVPSETFEHYLRRVVLRIVRRQKG